MSDDPRQSFSDTAIDHAQNPRHLTVPGQFNGRARITGPCGDTMAFWVLVRDGQLEDVTFVTSGCGSSRAAGSVTCCLAEGQSLEHVVALSQADVLAALGRFPEASQHCALLSVNTLRAACQDYQERGSLVPDASPQRIAVPVTDGQLAEDLAHCEQFAMVEAEPEMHVLGVRQDFAAPRLGPDLLPCWLADRGVRLVIAQGLGDCPPAKFAEREINVIAGAPTASPEQLVSAWLDGLLVSAQ